MSIWVLSRRHSDFADSYASRDKEKIVAKFITYIAVPYFSVNKVEEYLEDLEPHLKSYLELADPDLTKVPTVSERDFESLLDLFDDWNLTLAELLE